VILRGKYTGIKYITEVMELEIIGRGALQTRRRWTVRSVGAFGKENVGMSNDKAGEIPARRKTKVSNSTLNGVGLVGA
jgi:hypothetical protein